MNEFFTFLFQLIAFVGACCVIYIFTEEDDSCKYCSTIFAHDYENTLRSAHDPWQSNTTQTSLTYPGYRASRHRDSWEVPTYVSFGDNLELTNYEQTSL